MTSYFRRVLKKWLDLKNTDSSSAHSPNWTFDSVTKSEYFVLLNLQKRNDED